MSLRYDMKTIVVLLVYLDFRSSTLYRIRTPRYGCMACVLCVRSYIGSNNLDMAVVAVDNS